MALATRASPNPNPAGRRILTSHASPLTHPNHSCTAASFTLTLTRRRILAPRAPAHEEALDPNPKTLTLPLTLTLTQPMQRGCWSPGMVRGALPGAPQLCSPPLPPGLARLALGGAPRSGEQPMLEAAP